MQTTTKQPDFLAATREENKNNVDDDNDQLNSSSAQHVMTSCDDVMTDC